jgi:4-amino-4-deoxy-L-arabinose transferase-like glycosyltransferase
VILVYKLGRAVFNPDVGLIAALLLTFAPIALLLNATIMSHTSALFFGTLFMYGYWHLERLTSPQTILQKAKTDTVNDENNGETATESELIPVVIPPLTNNLKQTLTWGAVAGFGLGMMIINRPLSAIAIAAPFVIWSLIRLGRVVLTLKDRQLQRQSLLTALYPLIALSVVALVIALAIPIYNQMATGSPTTNLYTLVWSYDKVGFGPDYGKNGHTLEKGVQFARYDLSLLAGDLFGWQLGSFTKDIQQGLLSNDSYYPIVGVSWLLLLPGLVVGYKKPWALLWALNVGVWLWWLPSGVENNLNAWLLVGVVLLFSPLIFVIDDQDHRPTWTWLFMGIMVMLVAVHLAYWIGSQRYSTRYYFEMLSGAVIISALPIAWLIRQLKRPEYKLGVYGVVLAVCIWSLVIYSTPRIDALRGFNRITPALIQEVDRHRKTDKPLLVLVTGEKGVLPSWRSYGALMAATSPYLDSDIIVAGFDERGLNNRPDIVAQFPDREIIEMGATNVQGGDNAWFASDCQPHGTCPIANQPRQW